MALNVYTFNPYTGITAGILLIRDGVHHRTGRQLAPHIMCGSAGFIAVEKNWKQTGRLNEASVGTIEPAHGGAAFKVLVPKQSADQSIYCYVDAALPVGVRLRVNPEAVNAWHQLTVTDGVETLLADRFTASYFLRFKHDGDEVDIWYPNGHIARLHRRGTQIISVILSSAEIAAERIAQFNEQLNRLDLKTETGQRSCHGIIGSIVRLLRVTTDRGAQDDYVELLTEQLTNLTDKLRAEIRSVLLQLGHPYAGNFLSGSSSSVVMLRTHNPEAAAKRSVAARKRAERAERDRAERSAARGPSGQQGGANKNKKGNGKK